MIAVREDVFFESCGAGKIHACMWTPEEKPRAIIQIVHGIAEHVERYEAFAGYLNSHGFAVVGEDHMGHGASQDGDKRGYFHGGWNAAIGDILALMDLAKQRYGDLPYILFGHSMGSFMVRTILTDYPDLQLAGCVICGTGWQPGPLLSAGISACRAMCLLKGASYPSVKLHKLIFGAYNARVEHVRTPSDWLTRDKAQVDAYEADPLCGFVPSVGLLRDMLGGIAHIQKRSNLERMNRKLPCLLIAGGDDPVGDYGSGVQRTADAFLDVGMKDVRTKIYPLGRHEILNEINRQEVYEDVLCWISNLI